MKKSNAQDRMLDAYLNYILLKDNNDFSIFDFCKTMKISRSTFYSNFDGLWQLKEKTIERYKYKFNEFYSNVSCEQHDFNSFFPLFLDFVRKNDIYYKAMFKIQTLDGTDPLFLQFKEDCHRLMNIKKVEPNDQNYVFQFYSYGLISIIAKWIKDGYTKTISEITEIVRKCLINAL